MPRFCSSCGAPIGAASPVVCRACGAPHWANARPCAAALVVDGGKLLLTKRALEPWLGLWCAPSGFCNGAEHPIDAAVREAFEEAGVRVRITGYLGLWIDEYAPASSVGDDAEHVAVGYYHAVPTGEPDAAHDPGEVSDIGWFAPDQLPRELAPPVNGHRIFDAWRAAYEARDTASPLRERV